MTAPPKPVQAVLCGAPADEAGAAVRALEGAGLRVECRRVGDTGEVARALQTPLDLLLVWDGAGGPDGGVVFDLVERFGRQIPVVVLVAPDREGVGLELVGRGASALVYRDRLAPLTAFGRTFPECCRLRELVDLARASAHDLNNLVAPIPLATRILEDSVDGPNAGSLLRTIETSVERVTATVDSLYRCALWSAGEMETRSAPTPLRHLVEIVARTLRDRIPGLRVETDYPSDLPAVAGPAHALRQLLVCLALAAASGVSGEVTVSLSAACVTDPGGNRAVALGVQPQGSAAPEVVEELSAAARRLGGRLDVVESGAAGLERGGYRLRLRPAQGNRSARA